MNNDKLESLISKVFYNLDNNYNNNENYINYIKNRAILIIRNEDVDDINEQIINIFPGQAQEFLSADSVEDKDLFHQNVIDAEILTGSYSGKRVFISQIRITPSDADLPFQLVRHQFPIRLAFAMTINKAQGQTIPYMGLDLRNPVFAHGQLYVALSRVQSKNNIKILVKNDCIDKTGVYTKNIVYREIL